MLKFNLNVQGYLAELCMGNGHGWTPMDNRSRTMDGHEETGCVLNTKKLDMIGIDIDLDGYGQLKWCPCRALSTYALNFDKNLNLYRMNESAFQVEFLPLYLTYHEDKMILNNFFYSKWKLKWLKQMTRINE